MKAIKVVLVSIFLCGIIEIKAQQSVNNNVPKLLTVQQRDEILKKPNEVISLNKVKGNLQPEKVEKIEFTDYPIDQRAYKYYTQNEINEMSVKKKKDLNYLLNDSYEVVKIQNGSCPLFSKKDVNVLDYYYRRKQSVRNEIIVNEKCDYKIVLYSFDEVENVKKLITE